MFRQETLPCIRREWPWPSRYMGFPARITTSANYLPDRDAKYIPKLQFAFQRHPYGSCAANPRQPAEFLKTLKHAATEVSSEVVPAFCPVEATARGFFRNSTDVGNFHAERLKPYPTRGCEHVVLRARSE